MAFFDKFKDIANEAASTISDAAKDVSAGAKEMSEKAKLKRAIKAEEQKMHEEYKNIGEKYYMANVTAPQGYEDSFNVIRSSASEIERLQAELNKIEGANKCPDCGGKITPNQKFCQGCGRKLEE